MKRRFAAFFLSSLCVSAVTVPAAAQVVLEPGVISGQLGFTNTDAEVIAILQALGPYASYVEAWSVAPAGSSATRYASWPGSALQIPYDIHPNAAGGVTYDMTGTAVFYTPGAHPGSRYYRYATHSAGLLPDPDDDPAGLDFDLMECAGLVRLKWGEDPACASPATVQGAEVNTPRFVDYLGQASLNYLVVPEGTNQTIRLVTIVGNNPMTNLLRFGTDQPISVGCDQIQDICVDISAYGDGGAALGAFSGPFDVVGETHAQGSSFVHAWGGPDSNERYTFPSPAKSLSNDPASWWTLPNLVPGNYNVYGTTTVRAGRSASVVRTRQVQLSQAVAGSTSTLQETVGGVARYPLVMTPAIMNGSVRLADPYVLTHPGATSPLSTLAFNTGGQANDVSLTFVQSFSGQGNYSQTSFEGAFDPATGDLSSTYESVLVNPYDETTSWRSGIMQLTFFGPSLQTGGTTYIHGLDTDTPVPPGGTKTFDHRYCFNEVTLGYASDTAFTAPRALVSGSFSGADWEGTTRSYNVSADFFGVTPSNQPALSADVSVVVPQGSFTLTPQANVGGTNATFPAVKLTAGCGQRLHPAAGLGVSLDQLAECPGPGGALSVSGSVDSQGKPVSRIWYTVNDGPEIDLCASSCGVSPTFSTTVTLPPGCVSGVKVFASAPGVATAASAEGSIDACAEACQSDTCDGGIEEGTVQCATVERGLFGDVADADIDVDYGDWASGGYPFLWTGFSPHAHRTLTKFDVSFIPQGSTIVSADASWFSLWNEDHQIVRAHRVVQPWDEATVTWPNFGADTNFDAAVLGSFDAYGLGQKTVDLTVMYQDVVSCGGPDHGVILESDVPPDALDVAHTYPASEASSNRPRLEICWIAPCHAGCGE